jgi:hypothetical protein
MDPNMLASDQAPSRSTIIDLALQIGLVGLLVYACSRSYRLLSTSYCGLESWRLCCILCISAWPSGSVIAGRRC